MSARPVFERSAGRRMVGVWLGTNRAYYCHFCRHRRRRCRRHRHRLSCVWFIACALLLPRYRRRATAAALRHTRNAIRATPYAQRHTRNAIRATPYAQRHQHRILLNPPLSSICGNGTFSRIGDRSCTGCAVGKYTSSPGSVSCEACSFPSTTTKEASSTCDSCASDYFISDEATCVLCPHGSACPGDTFAPVPLPDYWSDRCVRVKRLKF